MTSTGTAALLKNISDLFDLADTYDEHAASIIVANEFEAQGYEISSRDVKSTLKTARLLMKDGELVSRSHSKAQAKAKNFVASVL